MTIKFDELLSQIDNVLHKKRDCDLTKSIENARQNSIFLHSCIIANHGLESAGFLSKKERITRGLPTMTLMQRHKTA